MHQQTGQRITFYAFYTASKVGKTGLTVTVDVRRELDGFVVSNNVAATEVGGGIYKYIVPGIGTTTASDYLAVFKTADSTVDQQHVMAEPWSVGLTWVNNLDVTTSSCGAASHWNYASSNTAEGPPGSMGNFFLTMLDAATSTRATISGVVSSILDGLLSAHTGAGTVGGKLNALGASGAAIASPIAVSGAITIQKGDDYLATDGRALDWVEGASASAASWPALTGASVVFVAGAFSKSLSVPTPTGTPKLVRLELLATESKSLWRGASTYAVVATLANGHVVTLASGALKVTS